MTTMITTTMIKTRSWVADEEKVIKALRMRIPP
jgi:hypothetical protein